MGKLLPFAPRQDERLRGPARCLGCGHGWEAVSPVGVYADLECPACGLAKGIREGLLAPGTRWVCRCGNDLHYVLPDGCMCVQCGTLASL